MAAEDAAAADAAPYASLRLSVAAWAALGATSWVLRTILYGLRIPWLAPPPPTRSKGYPLPEEERVWCREEVQRWVNAGFVRRLTCAAGAGSRWVSPSFVVHGGKDRLVVDLRMINRWIKVRRFQYQRLAHFLSTLVPGDHLVSWDVKDAFYHVRLWPGDWKYIRFVVDGVVYEPRVLPFGMRLSPWAWTKVLRPVVAALRRKGYVVMAYVDDFAATGRGARPSSAASATAGRIDILNLFRSLGIHVHPSKGVTDGTTRLPLLGYLVDTTRQLLLLPEDRLSKMVDKAKCLLSAANRDARRVRAAALRRFTGTAVSCSLAVPSARFYLRRLYDAQGRGTGTTRLTHGAVRDLTWFSHLPANHGVGRALWEPTAGTLTTDASPSGWGGHWNHTLPAAGFFSLAQRNWHINVKEVCAVRFCLLAFGRDMIARGKIVHLRVDNKVAMHVANSFTSRSPALMGELRRLHAVIRRLGVTLRATWVASVANVWADALSRQRDRDDWRLNGQIVEVLQARYGPHTVDRFATTLNTQCVRFNSLHRCPGTEAVDAFTVSWGAGENNWVNPPFSQAARVVDKIVAEQATATVILPVWTAQEWWAPAVARAQETWLLPADAGLFTSGHSPRPAPHPRWRMAVLRFVGGGRSDRAVQAARTAGAKADARWWRTRRHRLRAGGGEANARRWHVPPPAAALTLLPGVFCAPGPSCRPRQTDTTATGAPFPPPAHGAACRPSRRRRPPSSPSSGTNGGGTQSSPSPSSRC